MVDAHGYSMGRWTDAEHAVFLEGLRMHGGEKPWKRIAAMIPSRNIVQIRSHAQKYFKRLGRERKFI